MDASWTKCKELAATSSTIVDLLAKTVCRAGGADTDASFLQVQVRGLTQVRGLKPKDYWMLPCPVVEGEVGDCEKASSDLKSSTIGE
jgi:hypothetical protein